MEHAADIFELDFKGGKIKVQRHTLAGTQNIYRLVFSDGRPPLAITRGMGMQIGIHWTSIPEGRLKEAQEIGPLIEKYYK
jgi:hypothetical protein